MMKRIPLGMSVENLTSRIVIGRNNNPLMSGEKAPESDVMTIGDQDIVVSLQRLY